MDLLWIPHLSLAYTLCVALRRDILRKPLGLEFTEAQLAQEEDSFHLAAFDGEVLVGTLMLTPRKTGLVQMRQVAVHTGRQGGGIGKCMVAECEAEAKRRGFTRIELHARETAIPFYLKMGYTETGAPFEEVGISHQCLEKHLG